MPPLLVVAGLPDLSPEPSMVLPELPALSELLRLADPGGVDVDWRRGLLRDLGGGEFAADAPATIAAAVLALPSGTPVCLATPVHAVAGLSRVHLHAAGALHLDVEQSAAFASGFAAQFDGELRLHRAGGGWLIEAACAAEASDDDPLNLLGMPLERVGARSAQQRQLRRLGAEIEMWLADLPLNAERIRRGELPVNLLWMWGGGRVSERMAQRRHSPVRVHAADDDPWLAGCVALLGMTHVPLPEGWDAASQPRDTVILLQASPMTSGEQLLRWDEQWFGPLLRDMRAQHLGSVSLRFGRRALHVRRRLWSAPWRRRRPWWQAVSA